MFAHMYAYSVCLEISVRQSSNLELRSPIDLIYIIDAFLYPNFPTIHQLRREMEIHSSTPRFESGKNCCLSPWSAFYFAYIGSEKNEPLLEHLWRRSEQLKYKGVILCSLFFVDKLWNWLITWAKARVMASHPVLFLSIKESPPYVQ